MKLEIGKCYRNAYGDKVGPMEACLEGWTDEHTFRSPDGTTYMPDGKEHHDYKSGNDLISEWTEVSRAKQTPKPFGELSDAEKGVLLLAHHDGKRIEYLNGNNWCFKSCGSIKNFTTYRIAPTRVTGTCEVGPDGKPITETFEVSE